MDPIDFAVIILLSAFVLSFILTLITKNHSVVDKLCIINFAFITRVYHAHLLCTAISPVFVITASSRNVSVDVSMGSETYVQLGSETGIRNDTRGLQIHCYEDISL
jgi:hypothetical protein